MMKKTVKLYLSEHLELIIAVVLSCVAISGSLALLEKNFDFFYLGLLYLFIFTVCMGINFYKNIPLYASILSDISSEEDFFVAGKSALAKEERKRMEKVRHVYAEAMRTLQKENENYKLLINKWVHQMKTPLSVLSMLAQEKQSVSSELLEEETDRMNYLLNQILHLLRVENMANDFMIEKCCLAELIKSSINEQKNYFIQNEVYPKLNVNPVVSVYTDSKWFSFAIQQFLNNAAKYSDPGKAVNISADIEGGKAVLRIQDSGPGILPEDKPRIFEFCYTGKNGRKKQQESSGLGLYIAKNILDYLGHEVDVVSEQEKGTVFKFYLNTDR